IEKELGIEDLESIYDIKNGDTADWEKIDKLKESVSEILMKLADNALYLAKKTECRKCGFSSEKSNIFPDGKCPECGSMDLDAGRNKVVGYR
ncbi:MAG TPA: hypothetical protein VF857_11785, partial [Spirochaetota bacterium]